MYISYIVDFI